MKVLIIERDHNTSMLIEKTLQLMDINTIVSYNSHNAIEILQIDHENLNFIILSMTLPNGGTFNFLEKIANNKKYQKIPIFMFYEKSLERMYLNEDSPLKMYSFLKNLYSYEDLKDFLNDRLF